MAKPFTVVGIKSLPEGRYADGITRGLWLEVRGGSRLFSHRFKMNTISQTVGLGSISVTSLADARAKVAANREMIRQGINPKSAKAPKALAKGTFKDDVLSYYAFKEAAWVPDHATQWLKAFENHVFPSIGDRMSASLKAQDIADALAPIWHDKHPTANRVLSDIAAVINRAIEIDDEDDPRFVRPNPALRVRAILKQHIHEGIEHPAIPWQDAPALYKRLTAMDNTAAAALRFLLLCSCPRAAEITGAKWSEIDGTVFHVPAERMKAIKRKKKARDIPLSQAAVAFLETLPGDREEFIFKGRAGKTKDGVPFSGGIHDDAMRLQLRDMVGTMEPDANGIYHSRYDVHGLRACFRTWVKETYKDPREPEAAEHCLAHEVGSKVAQVYGRDDMFVVRRTLAERWAAYLMS
jgi:integrase